jgi:inosine-uridine nucleoside N-ribohydrolase
MKTRILLDTDLNTDCGDAGALALLHALADLGEADILGVGVSVSNPDAAKAVLAINEYYRRADVPLGQYQGEPPVELHGHAFVRAVAKMARSNLPPLPDTTALYRNMLAAQPDGSVTMVAIGFHNTLQRLLESPPDEISGQWGVALVSRKIQKLVVMGGQYPDSESITPLGGAEYNFWRVPRAAAYVSTHWPTPIAFAGFEVGEAILAGRLLQRQTPANNPVRVAYEVYEHPWGRSAWDETAIWYAVRGAEHGGVRYFDEVRGTNVVNPNSGGNVFSEGAGSHLYLKKTLPDEAYSKVFDELQVRLPRSQLVSHD